jgi:hypothetical protein
MLTVMLFGVESELELPYETMLLFLLLPVTP